MTITINGTTGISGVDGSAGTPALQGGDTNTGVFFPAADTVAVATGGSERMRIDSAGNLGLGATPSAWGGSIRAFQVGTTGSLYNLGGPAIGFNTYNNGASNLYLTSDYASIYSQTAGQHRWYNAPSGTAGNAITFTQAMTLDASGNLLVNTTTASARFVVNGIGGTSGQSFRFVGWGSGIGAAGTFEAANTSNADVIYFNTSAANVGKIAITSTATSYVTSSDYRLKENVQPMAGALAKVAALKPCTYTWKSDGSSGEGFIAHELAEVCPDAVTGEKDAVNEDGSIKPQGIDTSFLVATLTAAIQELNAKVEAQAAEIAALKGQA